MAVFDSSQVNLVLSSSAADLAMLAPGINSMLSRKSRNAQTPFGRISGFPR